MPFSAYLRVGPGRYRERWGLAFEDFEVGQRFRHRPGLTLSQQDNVEECLDTLNGAQVHYDAHYAARTEWKRPLGVSTLTLQRVLGMASKTYYRRESVAGFDEITMSGPVFGGDTLYAESEVTGLETGGERPGLGRVAIALRGITAEGAVVARIRAVLRVYRRGWHPDDRGAPGERAGEARFAAYRPCPDGTLLEQTGLFFEDLRAGEVFEHRPGKTLSLAESALHALRSLDLAPPYSDAVHARAAGVGGLRLSEPFVIGVTTALTTRTFGRVVANLGWRDVRLPDEADDGATLYAESEILAARESKSRPGQGVLEVRTRGLDEAGRTLCSYERTLLVYRRGGGPHEAAGY